MQREYTVITALEPDRRAGAPHPRAVHRRIGQRGAVLRDVVRRGPHPAGRTGRGRADRGRAGPGRATRSSTPWPDCTRSTSTRSASATSPGATATSPASSSGGTASSPSPPSTAQPGPAVVDRVHELLAARIPEQQGVSIVHGDYRLDNTVLDDDGQRVRAILDWEICTLGDPLADLGLLLVYWAEPGDGDQALLGVAPTTLPGLRPAAGPPGPLRPGLRTGRLRDRLLPGVRILEAGLYPPGGPCALRRRGRRRGPIGRRPVRRPRRSTGRAGAGRGGVAVTDRDPSSLYRVRSRLGPRPRRTAVPPGPGGRPRRVGRRRHGGVSRHRLAPDGVADRGRRLLRHRAAHRPAGPPADRTSRGRGDHRADLAGHPGRGRQGPGRYRHPAT